MDPAPVFSLHPSCRPPGIRPPVPRREIAHPRAGGRHSRCVRETVAHSPRKVHTVNPKKPAAKPGWQRALITLAGVVTTAFVFTTLYWMRTLFIPLALAVFFTYVLAPLV